MCLSFSITVKKQYRVTFSFAIVQALRISYSFMDQYFDVQFSLNMFFRDDSKHSELRPLTRANNCACNFILDLVNNVMQTQ